MEEQNIFELASEIANKISANCKTSEDLRRILQLIKELLEVRWSILLLKPSS